MSKYTTAERVSTEIRYSDASAQLWLWNGAPISWAGRVEILFEEVRFPELEPATSLNDPAVVAYWSTMILANRAIPPIVASRTGHGSFYIHDGNHRFVAFRACFPDIIGHLVVRVAVVQARPGYTFRYRRFRSYGTYLLEPAEMLLRASETMRRLPLGHVFSPSQFLGGGEVCMSR